MGKFASSLIALVDASRAVAEPVRRAQGLIWVGIVGLPCAVLRSEQLDQHAAGSRGGKIMPVSRPPDFAASAISRDEAVNECCLTRPSQQLIVRISSWIHGFQWKSVSEFDEPAQDVSGLTAPGRILTIGCGGANITWGEGS